jgi:hypothetical protein
MWTEYVLCYVYRSNIQVAVGSLQWKTDADKLINISTAGLYVHHEYDPFSLHHDIALLRLPKALEFTSKYPS